MTKKQCLKVSYVLHSVFLVAIAMMWFMQAPWIFWKLTFVLVVINLFIFGFLFIDLIPEKK